MLEHSHYVGESLVQRQYIRIRGLQQSMMNAINNGMRYLMGNDVM